jgi:hypothetical protein
MEPEKSLIKEFVDGGWVIPLIGAAAMVARLLSTGSKLGIVEQIKKIFAASISSGVAWFVLEQTDISSLYKAITYGIIGVVSPEVINGLVRLAKRFQSNPENYIP